MTCNIIKTNNQEWPRTEVGAYTYRENYRVPFYIHHLEHITSRYLQHYFHLIPHDHNLQDTQSSPNMSSQLATNMRNTTDLFIKGWEAWNVESVMATWAPECVMLQVPKSLNIPVRNIDEFRAWFASVESQLSDCKVVTI